jgi:hypothetical protein
MSNAKQPDSIPKPPQTLPPLRPSSPPQRLHGTRAHGARECDFTTVKFALESNASVQDTLTIEIPSHNASPLSRLRIQGQCEIVEMAAHFQWLSDQLSQLVGNRKSVSREYVTFSKGCGVPA